MSKENMNNNLPLKLTDEAIAAIVRIIQFGLLSGQDVTDHFRNLEFCVEQDSRGLMPTGDWITRFTDEMCDINELLLNRVENMQLENESSIDNLPPDKLVFN